MFELRCGCSGGDFVSGVLSLPFAALQRKNPFGSDYVPMVRRTPLEQYNHMRSNPVRRFAQCRLRALQFFCVLFGCTLFALLLLR